MQQSIGEFEKPMFDVHGLVRDAANIKTIELLKREKQYFVRSRAANGAVGVGLTKQVEPFIPIFRDIVAPCFIGRDGRDIETLIDDVYRANYKLAGIPFWCPVAYIEQSILDMLGRMAGEPVGGLLGGVLRKEVPVYLSGSGRNTTAEEEVEVYVRGVEETGTKRVKFKIGGRMSRNADACAGRTEKLIKLARQRLGDDVTLYADANGSYDAKEATRIGRMLEEYGYKMFEEPCPWEELTETQQVTKTLDIPVSCGEQDSSLWRFKWMMENGVMDIVQPDINYNGGLIRAIRVARMAEKHGMKIVPHNTQRGPASVNILQFASCVPNIGEAMEHTWRQPQWGYNWCKPDFLVEGGVLRVPEGPGLGIEIDQGYLAGAEVVAKIE